MFPVSARDRTYHPKALVAGVVIDGQSRAYPFDELSKVGKPLIEQIGSTTIRVQFDPAAKSAWVERLSDGSVVAPTDLPSVTAYWFAWYAFHPDTSVFVYEEE